MLHLDNIISFADHFSYLGFFIYLAVVGYLLPIPEEIFLVVVGFLAGTGKINVFITLIVCIGGVMLGDNIFYWLAFRGNKYIKRLLGRVTSSRLDQYNNFLEQNITLSLVLMRFLVGLRFLGPVLAGTARVSWRRFFLNDFLAVTLYTSSFVYLGFAFAGNLKWVVKQVGWFRHFVIIFVILAGVFWLANLFYVRIRGQLDNKK